MNEFIEVPLKENHLSKVRVVSGVAVNDATYKIVITKNGKRCTCPYYSAWVAMLGRCFSVKIKERFPTYKDCTVSDEWLVFSNFKKWMASQNWKGKQLDKDLLIPGNKHYSSSTCIFISNQINSLLNSNEAKRGVNPQGVSFSKKSGKYEARCSINGTRIYSCGFSSASAAEIEYLSMKYSYIKDKAYCEEAISDPRLHLALLNHCDIVGKKIERLGGSIPTASHHNL